MATTALCYIGPPEGNENSSCPSRNAYFALSKPLKEYADRETTRIAICRADWSLSPTGNEKTWRDKLEKLMVANTTKLTTEKLCARLSKDEEKRFFPLRPVFYDARDYLADLAKELAGETHGTFTYQEFETWFTSQKNRTLKRECKGFDAIDVWKEIRGLIKGYLGSAQDIGDKCAWHWAQMFFPRGNDSYLGDEAPSLRPLKEIAWTILKDERCAIARDKDRGKGGLLCKATKDDYERCCIAAEQKDHAKDVQTCIRLIFKAAGFDFDGDVPKERIFVDARKKGLSREEYMKLGRYSIFDEEKKSRLYTIYEAYEKEKGDKWDENDCARVVAALALQPSFQPRFFSVFVDECQDFTEMQLLALAALKHPDGKNAFMGDFHQIVNPSYFDPGRIQTLLDYLSPKRAAKAVTGFLKENFRSRRQIMELVNVIKKKRQECIGKTQAEFEQEEVGRGDDGAVDFRNDSDKSSLAKLLKAYDDSHDALILVSGDEDKDRIKQWLRGSNQSKASYHEGAEEKTGAGANVRTIKEVKGLERETVICYNLLGRHEAQWKRILEKDKSEVGRNAKYRYYFNLLYVAATRPQKHLILIENEKTWKLHSWLLQGWRQGDWYIVDPMSGLHDLRPQGEKQEEAHEVPAIAKKDWGNVVLFIEKKDWEKERADPKGWFDRGKASFDWFEDTQDAVAPDAPPEEHLRQALEEFRKARNLHRPGCGVEADEIDKWISRCECEERGCQGEAGEKELWRLYDEGWADAVDVIPRFTQRYCPELEELGKFLNEPSPSFTGKSPESRAELISHLANNKDTGLDLLDQAFEQTLQNITSITNELSGEASTTEANRTIGRNTL